MANIYSVMTVERGGRTIRRSLTSDERSVVDVSVREGADDITYRLEVSHDGGARLLSIDKRWKEANDTPTSAWEELFVW